MHRPTLLLACALLAACGGNDDIPRPEPTGACRPNIFAQRTEPDPGSGPVDCHALDGYELFLLDNFEIGQASVGWYTNNDRSAVSDPLPDTDPPPASAIPDGRCAGVAPSTRAATVCDTPDVARGGCTRVLEPESRSALHITTGLLTGNGGQLGRTLPLTCDTTAPACPFRAGPPEVGACSTGMGSTPPTSGCSGYDLSLWEGVVFWARKAPNSADTVKVRTSDVSTDDKGCICDPYTNQNDSSTGCDKFSAFVPLDGDFKAYLVPFSRMQQGGWGMRSPEGLDTGGLFSLAIEYGRGAWDLWLDDIGFYRSKP